MKLLNNLKTGCPPQQPIATPAAHDGVQVAGVCVSVVPAVGWVHLVAGIIAAKIFVGVGLDELAAFLDICNFIFHCCGVF